jgi:hydroxymethylpyrimidine/phosphomethylpyrimidine kinase
MDPKDAGNALPVVLAVAGFDPTSGAGVSADLKTFAAHNCYGVAAVTAITLQTTQGVHGVHCLPARIVSEQVAAIAEDIALNAVKIGMLGSAENVEAVVEVLERFTPPFVVLDPVFRSSSGAVLLEEAGIDLLRERLLPKVTLVTPNLQEAERIAGRTVQSVEDMKAAAADIHARYGALAVVTGGHLEKPQDLFYDGASYTVFAGDRIRSENTHGTGCAFSSAVAANLALGKPLAEAIVLAKVFVTQAIEKGHALGRGRGTLNHLYRLMASAPPRAVVTDAGGEAHSAGHR